MSFLERIKQDLAETSTESATITVSRKQLQLLVKSYETLLKNEAKN